MTIHVNIGEAKTRLSQLIAVVEKGEEVVIDRAGKPTARLVAIDSDTDWDIRLARRKAFFGSLRGQLGNIDWTEPTFTEEELDRFESPEF